jgi:DNA-binding response OmpR family regulator
MKDCMIGGNSMNTGYRILICEPDAKSRRVLIAGLDLVGHEIVWCNTSAKAVDLLDGEKFDSAIICLQANSTELEVFDWIARTACDVPVLIATPPEAVGLRIQGLNRGAVDYLIKPFGANELLARVATVLCSRESVHGRYMRQHGLVLDMVTGYFGNGTKWIVLSPKERQAFSLLLEHEDRPVSKSRLKSALAGREQMTDNTLEVLIFRLRAKASQWGLNIRVYRGSGYVLEYP